MKQLLEDYQRRLVTIEKLIAKNTNNGSISDVQRATRLQTKAGEFRSIITELEREMRNHPIDTTECTCVMDVIKLIPQQGQVQYDLTRQLQELRIAANMLGLYDAADYLKPEEK